jgi:copper(I)-binding protein
MRGWRIGIGYVLAAVLMLAGCGSPGGQTPPDVRIREAWARPTVYADGVGSPVGGTAAVYLKMVNIGDYDTALLEAISGVAGSTLLHETRIEDDVASMHSQHSGVSIPARATVVFEPGGKHIMLIDLRQPLIEGETFAVTLRFRHGQTVSVPVTVEDR